MKRILGLVLVFAMLFTSGWTPCLADTTPTETTTIDVNEIEELKKGMKGESVKRLQEALKGLAFLTGNVDGDYGKMTSAAVSAFQKNNELDETGIADIETQALLYQLYDEYTHVENHVENLSLDASEFTINVGEVTDPVICTIEPADAYYSRIIWKTSDDEVATVDESGIIKAVGGGKATITATTNDPSAVAKSCSIDVTVIQKPESIKLSSDTYYIVVGKTGQAKATVRPKGATDKSVEWSSSDKDIVTVDKKGNLKATGIGTAEIICTSVVDSNITASATVEVFAPVKTVTLEKSSLKLAVPNRSKALKYTISPSDAKYQTVHWISSDENVATVDENGVVTAVHAGKATITLVSDEPIDSPKSASIKVTITQPATGISLPETLSLAKNSSKTLKPVFEPEDTTDKSVVWSSSNKKVATVTSTGSVKGIGVGTAEISCTTKDGSEQTAVCRVTVFQAVTGITPGKTKVSVTKGEESKAISFKVSPKDASNKGVHWKSSDEKIATVDENGVITGVSCGKCKVTISPDDGSKVSATINVTVEPKIPLEATTFTRSGYFGYYNEFAVTFKNLTATRTIDYISFTVEYTDGNGNKRTINCSDDSITLGPGSTKKEGWWKDSGLTYGRNFIIKLKMVHYKNGNYDSFSDDNIIGILF